MAVDQQIVQTDRQRRHAPQIGIGRQAGIDNRVNPPGQFGVIRQKGTIKLYGSGLISSHGEGTHVIQRRPQIRDFNLDQVLEQKFLVSEEQKVLYAIESFDQMFEAAQEAEKRLS